MKAYYISIDDNPDAGGNLVFANNYREAKQPSNTGDLMYERWIDIRCRRMPHFDGMENLSERELDLAKWRNGWWCCSNEPVFTDDEETTDQDFLDWWDGANPRCGNNGGKVIGAGHECVCNGRKGHYGKHGCECGGMW